MIEKSRYTAPKKNNKPQRQQEKKHGTKDLQNKK